MQRFILALLALALAACGPKPEQDEQVRSFFDHVRTGQYEAIKDDLAPNLKSPEAQAQLEDIRRRYIPEDAPSSATRANWSFNTVFGGDSTAVFIYRYDYADRTLMVTTNTRATQDGPTLIEGFHVNVTPLAPGSAAVASDFSLTGKPPVQLAFFVAMVVSGVLMLWAFFGVIFTKGFKRKWLFAILAFAGAPILYMNWTTGEWGPTFSAGLINLGVSRGLGPLDPWIVKFHIPIGALVALSVLWPRWAGLSPPEEKQAE